jgi:hypothetical protein
MSLSLLLHIWTHSKSLCFEDERDRFWFRLGSSWWTNPYHIFVQNLENFFLENIRDSSVSIATQLGWTVRGSNPGGGEVYHVWTGPKAHLVSCTKAIDCECVTSSPPLCACTVMSWGDLYSFLIEKADALAWRCCKWVIRRCCLSYTRNMASNDMGEETLNMEMAMTNFKIDCVMSRFSCTATFQYNLSLMVGNSA